MDKATLKEIQKKTRWFKATDARGYWELFSNLCMTFAAIAFSLSSSWMAWSIGQLVLLICIWRWFGILHSAVHSTVFKTPNLNLFIGHLASIFTFISFESWKKNHLEHHRWTGWRDLDPSLSLPTPDQISPLFKFFLDVCWKLHIPIFSLLSTMSEMFSGKKMTVQTYELSWRSKIIFPLAHLILFCVLGLSYFKVFLLPFLVYLSMSDIMILSQHNILENEKLVGEARPIALWEHPDHTITLRYPKWVSKHVFLYFDKHTLHHLVPHVPHYHIEALGEWGIPEEKWNEWIKRAKKVPGHKVYLS